MHNVGVLKDTCDRARESTRTTDDPAGPAFSKCDPDDELFMFMRGGDHRPGSESVQDNYPDLGFRLVVEVQDIR